MASDRFVKLSEADIKSFSEEQENVGAKKKTVYDLNFKEFLISEFERKELQEIPAAELQQLAIEFVQGVRKKNAQHSCLYMKKKITRWLDDMNFTFSW